MAFRDRIYNLYLVWTMYESTPTAMALWNEHNAVISTNATCGENGPEMYCKLVEHVPGRPIRNPQCRICDSNSANRKERHPIVSAIDGTNNWWQSPSIQNGRKYHWVTITLDLRQSWCRWNGPKDLLLYQNNSVILFNEVWRCRYWTVVNK
eukprot:g38216.t1